MPRIALKLHLLAHLIFGITLRAKHCYYLPFPNGKTEAKKHQVTCPSPAVVKWWSQDTRRESILTES